jgi:pimeloyl-ACP methyl ester carboxylesterase
LRHKLVEIDGPVHYLDFSRTEAGSGGRDPVVMVHGLGGSAINWLDVGPALAEGRSAVALDLAGFGETPLFERSAAVGANADLVARFIRKLFDEPVNLVGNSMGGHIAVLVAADHPQLVRRLVLVDPAVPGVHVRRPEPAMIGVMAALSVPGLAETVLARRVRVLGPDALVEQTLALVCADPSRLSPEIVEAHIKLTRERGRLGPQSNRAFIQATRSIGLRMADPRFWQRAQKVTAPTLVIQGELDRVIPVAAARELVRRLPSWRLEVLEGVGHVPMMETPGAFLTVMNGFFANTIAPTPATIP